MIWSSQVPLVGSQYYESKVFSEEQTWGVATISGGNGGGNTLEAHWKDFELGVEGDDFFDGANSQQIAQGSVSNLVMWRLFLLFVEGTTPKVTRLDGGSWTTPIAVPGTYYTANVAGYGDTLYVIGYNLSDGSYDLFEFDGAGFTQLWTLNQHVSYDAPNGGLRMSFAVDDINVYFLYQAVNTDGSQVLLAKHRLDTGGLVWEKVIHEGRALSGGFNGFFYGGLSLNAARGWVRGAYYTAQEGANPPNLNYVHADTESGHIEKSGILQQYFGGSNTVPAFGLTGRKLFYPGDLTLNGDRNSMETYFDRYGNPSTQCISEVTLGSSWVDFAKVGETHYLAAGLTDDNTLLKARSRDSLQAGGANLTVALIETANFLNFAQFADGSGFGSQVTLTNADDEERTVTIHLRDTAGQDLGFDLDGDTLTIPGSQQTGTAEVAIPAGGVRILRTDGQGDLVVGTARIEVTSDVSGVVTFGGAFGLASVASGAPFSDGFSAPMETNADDGINTGVAVMNLTGEENTLTAVLRSSQGAAAASAAPIVLPAWGQRALFVNEFEWDTQVEFEEFQGVLEVTTTGRGSATVLETRPNQLGTKPVRPL